MLEFYGWAYVVIAVLAFFARWRGYRDTPPTALGIALIWPVWLLVEWVVCKVLGAVFEVVGKAVGGLLLGIITAIIAGLFS